MSSDITKKESHEMILKEDFPVTEKYAEISDIISNNQMKDFMDTLLGEFDSNREESLDMYYIFKDLITNSGDFDSSPAVKEQVAALLKVAQDASSAKMRIFDSLIKSKMKKQIIEHTEIKQNNVFMNTDRRSLLKELERMKEENAFSEAVVQTDEIEKELNLLHEENKKEENITSKDINNDEEVDFEIQSGDF